MPSEEYSEVSRNHLIRIENLLGENKDLGQLKRHLEETNIILEREIRIMKAKVSSLKKRKLLYQSLFIIAMIGYVVSSYVLISNEYSFLPSINLSF